jgi:hypothetical protein
MSGCCLLWCFVQIVLSSDEEAFGGWKNVTKSADVTFEANKVCVSCVCV